MKKLSLILTLICGLFVSSAVKGQSTSDYFPGKWTITVVGTPNGDTKVNFIFERKDGKLSGIVQDTTGVQISQVTQIVEQGKTLTAAFSAQGYDVTMTLEPVDADHVKGNVLGMFEAKGFRVKESE